MCDLLSDVRPYLTRIEASGQRNVKKAQRLGYRFGPLDYNAHVHEVVNIRRSNDERQGRVSLLCRACSLKPVMNPAPLNDYHRYDYYGVFREGALHAYAACFQAGQVCLIEQVFGHADDLADGVVPMLLAGIAQHLTQFPHVQYYCYGTTFGAPTSMRRFKKKFLFYPHNVIWELG
jgi:hypothetical protein